MHSGRPEFLRPSLRQQPDPILQGWSSLKTFRTSKAATINPPHTNPPRSPITRSSKTTPSFPKSPIESPKPLTHNRVTTSNPSHKRAARRSPTPVLRPKVTEVTNMNRILSLLSHPHCTGDTAVIPE